MKQSRPFLKPGPLPVGCTYAVVCNATGRAVYVGPRSQCRKYRMSAVIPDRFAVVSL